VLFQALINKAMLEHLENSICWDAKYTFVLFEALLIISRIPPVFLEEQSKWRQKEYDERRSDLRSRDLRRPNLPTPIALEKSYHIGGTLTRAVVFRQ
jgi:hypothetical protein